MLLLSKITDAGSQTAFNIEFQSTISVNGSAFVIYIGSQRILEGVPDAVDRFNDIIDAYAADVKVYDVNKPIGDWKPKKHTGRKAAPAKKEAEPKESPDGSGS